MKKYKYLSYFIDQNTPIYGGKSVNEIKEISSIKNGDSSNSKKMILNNHTGTHIDFPNHFCLNGKTCSDYPPDFWIFQNPFVINLNSKENEIIMLSDKQLKNIPIATDFLIINTGFHCFRGNKKYWNNNPGINPMLASKLKERCPKIRMIGLDTISLSSYQNRELGRKSHREFLCNNDILIVEDMDLRDTGNDKFSKVTCFPLLIKDIDGCPITIVAEVDKNEN